MLRRKDRPAGAVILPGYRDVAEIGGGAFATVYRASEEDTGRQVALKVLKVDTLHPHLLETFTQEIQAMAKVSDHPNIVTLYRPLATPDGRPVLVLELCRESLAQQVRRTGPIGAAQVTRIGIKIAGALETAHRHGFLHRDMKPQNILVTQFGEPALGDFGVAALQASAQATAGVFGFTTLHAAPEILEGHHLSPATDVYGLASTMYQLLTGLAPFATFEGEAPASVILRIIRDPVRPLRGEGIPIGLSDLLEGALSKDPEGRPRRAVEFADALVAVEAAAGWDPTAYVAWGEDESPATEPAAAREAQPASAPVALLDPGSRSPLQASAPSLTVPDVALERPVFSPPGRQVAPATPEPAPASPPPAAPDPERAPASPPPAAAPERAPASPPPATPSPPTPPPPWKSAPPPPPMPPTRPSLVTPAIPARHVIEPDRAGRGPAPPEGPPAVRPPLPPLRGAPGSASERPLDAERPVFVDPPVEPDPGGSGGAPPRLPPPRAESVYEQTILPSAGTVPPRRHDELVPSRIQQLMASPLLLGGMAAAAVVVLAAVLLIIGVL